MDYNLIKDLHKILGISSVVVLFILTILMIFLYFSNKSFNKIKKLSKYNLMLFHSQIVMGIIIFFSSPVVKGFLKFPRIGMKLKDVRFYSIEHPFMMILLAVIITLLNISIKKNKRVKSIIYVAIASVLLILGFPFDRIF